MSTLVKYTPPTLAELTADVEEAYKNDQFNLLLNQPPIQTWVKEHPFIRGYRYLPIDKIELLLKKIFKRYRIEITGQGTSFNGVWVTVRVHYYHPIHQEWDYHDGIGAAQLQTKKDTSPADLVNINNGAISMAFPMAKTIAVKDACDHFGDFFGANLNRKDVIQFEPDKNLMPEGDIKEISLELEAAISEADKENLANIYKSNPEYHSNPRFMELLTKRKEQLNGNAS